MGTLPKVMDMFAGGVARFRLRRCGLGCEVIANDYNPVAWFLLKCTLEYPQRLSGKTHPLPNLSLDEQPNLTKNDLADHVRLWGQWVLENARSVTLAQYYPMIDEKPTVAYLWATNNSLPRSNVWRDGSIAQDPMGLQEGGENPPGYS